MTQISYKLQILYDKITEEIYGCDGFKRLFYLIPLSINYSMSISEALSELSQEINTDGFWTRRVPCYTGDMENYNITNTYIDAIKDPITSRYYVVLDGDYYCPIQRPNPCDCVENQSNGTIPMEEEINNNNCYENRIIDCNEEKKKEEDLSSKAFTTKPDNLCNIQIPNSVSDVNFNAFSNGLTNPSMLFSVKKSGKKKLVSEMTEEEKKATRDTNYEQKIESIKNKLYQEIVVVTFLVLNGYEVEIDFSQKRRQKILQMFDIKSVIRPDGSVLFEKEDKELKKDLNVPLAMKIMLEELNEKFNIEIEIKEIKYNVKKRVNEEVFPIINKLTFPIINRMIPLPYDYRDIFKLGELLYTVVFKELKESRASRSIDRLFVTTAIEKMNSDENKTVAKFVSRIEKLKNSQYM